MFAKKRYTSIVESVIFFALYGNINVTLIPGILFPNVWGPFVPKESRKKAHRRGANIEIIARIAATGHVGMREEGDS